MSLPEHLIDEYKNSHIKINLKRGKFHLEK